MSVGGEPDLYFFPRRTAVIVKRQPEVVIVVGMAVRLLEKKEQYGALLFAGDLIDVLYELRHDDVR